MSLKGKIYALEKDLAPAGVCIVQYKVGCGPAGSHEIPQEKALEAARKGLLKSITFPLSFHEQQAERASGRDLWAAIGEAVEGVRRDTGTPSMADRLILCSRPIIFARQAPVEYSGGQPLGGNFITDDGEEFHQSQWKELLDKRGAGFIIVQDYDESKEPWHAAGKESSWKGIK